MRRKDREMSREFGLAVIDRASFGTLCMTDTDGSPYAIPLSIAREGELLYFHSAKAGKKVELMEEAPAVRLVFVGEHQVPAVMSPEEAQEAASSPQTFSALTSKLFTTEFESAILRGKLRKAANDEEKIRGLRRICEKFTPQWMRFFDQAVAHSLQVTEVYVIEIEEVTAKRKKFDLQGEEMKWQRVE